MPSGPSVTGARLPVDLQHALAGHSLATCGWIWIITGVIFFAPGILVLGPASQSSAEAAHWIGVIAAALGAISGIILVPYYPVWALTYVALAVTVVLWAIRPLQQDRLYQIQLTPNK